MCCQRTFSPGEHLSYCSWKNFDKACGIIQMLPDSAAEVSKGWTRSLICHILSCCLTWELQALTPVWVMVELRHHSQANGGGNFGKISVQGACLLRACKALWLPTAMRQGLLQVQSGRLSWCGFLSRYPKAPLIWLSKGLTLPGSRKKTGWPKCSNHETRS